jgi:hypothetical protein
MGAIGAVVAVLFLTYSATLLVVGYRFGRKA